MPFTVLIALAAIIVAVVVTVSLNTTINKTLIITIAVAAIAGLIAIYLFYQGYWTEPEVYIAACNAINVRPL